MPMPTHKTDKIYRSIETVNYYSFRSYSNKTNMPAPKLQGSPIYSCLKFKSDLTALPSFSHCKGHQAQRSDPHCEEKVTHHIVKSFSISGSFSTIAITMKEILQQKHNEYNLIFKNIFKAPSWVFNIVCISVVR